MIITKLIRLVIASVLGLTMAIALTFIAATGIASGALCWRATEMGRSSAPPRRLTYLGPGTITATTDVLISPTVAITIAANTTIRVWM